MGRWTHYSLVSSHLRPLRLVYIKVIKVVKIQFSQDMINFASGNPFVEVTKGILHLYKENQTTSLEDGVIRSQMICKF